MVKFGICFLAFIHACMGWAQEQDQLIEEQTQWARDIGMPDDLVSQMQERLQDQIQEGHNFKDTSWQNWLQIPFLDKEDLIHLKKHIRKWGPLNSRFEILAIEGLEEYKKKWLLKIPDLARPHKLPIRISDSWLNSSKELTQSLFIKTSDLMNPRDLNAKSPWKHYLRCRIQTTYQWDAALILEKDAGEPYLHQAFPKVDYKTAYIQYRNGGILRKCILGNYAPSFASALNTGFVPGRNRFSLFQLLNELLPYRSLNESGNLRGLAAELNFRSLELNIWLSHQKKDATINDSGFSSWYTSGLHRTNSELAKRRKVSITEGGVVLEREGAGMVFWVANTGVPFRPNDFIHEVFARPGSTFYKWGLFYSRIFTNGMVKGELSLDDGFSMATHHSVLWIPDRKLKVQLEGMYQSAAWLFSEQKQMLRMGWEYQLSSKLSWKGNGMAEQGLWLPYRSFEYRARRKIIHDFLYQISRKETFLVRLYYSKNSEPVFTKKGLRIHYQWEALRNIRWMNRIELNQLEGRKGSVGKGVYADIRYAMQKVPLRIHYRYTWLSMDTYDNRIYSYENNVLYAYSLTSLFGNGSRNSFLFVYRPDKAWRLSLRSLWIKNQQKETNHGLNDYHFNLQVHYKWE